MLETKPLKIKEDAIIVEALVTARDENNLPALSNAILVTGFSENTSSDELKSFFQDRLHSGGESIETIYKVAEDKQAVIVFNNNGGME